jgi:hypothetical protein
MNFPWKGKRAYIGLRSFRKRHDPNQLGEGLALDPRAPVTRSRRRALRLPAIAALGYSITVAACGKADLRSGWRDRSDSSSYRDITGLEVACVDCIELVPSVTLGTDGEQGLLEDNGTIEHVVHDGSGRFWVGQRGSVKVYNPNGKFVAQVGRLGKGPMEFEHAQPSSIDRSGMVHILDLVLGRETIVRPDFALHGDRKFPQGFGAAEALPSDSPQYVMAKWITTPDRIGLPLHFVASSEIVRSFGLTPRSKTATVPVANSPRLLAPTSDGYVLSSMVEEYLIEAWNNAGERVAGFELKGLNTAEVRPGVWAADNPPPNVVGDITSYDERHVLVLTRHRRSNWKDLVVEKVTRSGLPYLSPANDQVTSIFRSRLDLVDLNTASVVASSWNEGFLLQLIGPNLVTRLTNDSVGSPLLEVLNVRLRRRN